jgi:hypothetical protein
VSLLKLPFNPIIGLINEPTRCTGTAECLDEQRYRVKEYQSVFFKEKPTPSTSSRDVKAVSFPSDAKSSLGDAKSSVGDAKSSLGDVKSSLGDA